MTDPDDEAQISQVILRQHLDRIVKGVHFRNQVLPADLMNLGGFSEYDRTDSLQPTPSAPVQSSRCVYGLRIRGDNRPGATV